MADDMKEVRERVAVKAAWSAPSLQELPRLTDLTLQSFIPGGGIPGGGGSTVF